MAHFHQHPVGSVSHGAGNGAAFPASESDLLLLVEASQAMSEELELGPLLRRVLDAICGSTGASRCVLMENRGDELFVSGEARTTSGVVTTRVLTPPRTPTADELPLEVIREAWRSGDRVVLGEGACVDDRYLRARAIRSAVCLPLDRSGLPTGLLYLESPHAGIFTPQRIVALEVLRAQAAISLENAHLYAELRDSQVKLRRLYDANIIGVVFCGADGSIDDANDYYLDMIGFTRRELEAGHVRWDTITPPEWRAADEKAIVTLEATGIAKPYEKEYLRRDGRRVSALITGAALRKGTRQLAAFVLDITKRKQGERALEFLAEASRILASSLDDASTLAGVAELSVPRIADWCLIAFRHPDGPLRTICVATDPANAEVASELARTPLPESATEGLVRVLRTGESVRYESMDEAQLAALGDERHGELVRQLGIRSALALPFTIREHRLGGMLLASTNGNHRYTRVELAYAEELARRCAVAIENAYLYEDALRAARTREEFLSITSHELRAPLSPLRMQIELAREMIAKDPAGATQLLVRADQQVDRIVRLVDDLLDVSRITAGKLQLHVERVDLAALVEDVVKRFSLELERVRCPLTTKLARDVIGKWDHGRIEQVVVNLLSNAMKFGAGKPIELEVTRVPDGAALRVRDHGIGIASGDCERIFERFERATPIRGHGGLGLGLYIVRELVAAHRGSIAVESVPGEGACFTVQLPIR